MNDRLKKFWLLPFLLLSLILFSCSKLVDLTDTTESVDITDTNELTGPNEETEQEDIEDTEDTEEIDETEEEKEESTSTEPYDPDDERPDIIPLSILSINDLHGYIEQEEDGSEGLSNAAYLINQIRNEDDLDNVILIGNGDMFQGTFISNMTQGRVVIDAMNEMVFDAMGIGNHEFDWGIDVILDYFDGNPDNGEANFPLLNANIFVKSNDNLLTVDGGKVYDQVVIEREGIQIGVISYIGDVYRSISYERVQDYYFDLDIAGSVSRIGQSMKDSGVDVIIVNIHGGSGSKIQDYDYNVQLAQLKDADGEYLVDAVINGHTHRYQYGTINRSGGVSMPVVQAKANGEFIGRITLNYQTKTNDIVSYRVDVIDVSDARYQYDSNVEAVIQRHRNQIEDIALVEAGETIKNRSQFYNWIGNVMMAATGSDIAIHNNGGVRGDGDIMAGEDIYISQMYEISPFDNPIFVFEATYDELRSLLKNSSLFYTKTAESKSVYRVAIISYVYYNYKEMNNLRDRGTDTGLYIRDILVEDLRLKGEQGIIFRPSTDPSASIGNLWGH